MSLDILIEQVLDRIEERVRRVLREERAGVTSDLLTYAEAGALVRRSAALSALRAAADALEAGHSRSAFEDAAAALVLLMGAEER